MPKVSVLMPVYNTKETHLKESIESILSQTYDDFEFLILNDASTDSNVEKIVKSYKDNRIKYYKNDNNLGISGTRNKLLNLSSGEFLSVMDHDDISFPERLKKQVEFLEKNPDIGVVGAFAETFPKKGINKKPIINDDIEENLMFSCAILHPASMIRKKVLIDNNIKYEKEFSPAEDYALWCRLIGKTRFANLPEILLKYRIHDSNTSKTQKDKMFKCSQKIYNFVRKDNNKLWEFVKEKAKKTYRVKLFGIIPFLNIKKENDSLKISLFKIPLLKINKKISL